MSRLQFCTELQYFIKHCLIDDKATLSFRALHIKARLKIAARKVACQKRTDSVFSTFQPLRQAQAQIQPFAVHRAHFPHNARFIIGCAILHRVARKPCHALERHAYIPFFGIHKVINRPITGRCFAAVIDFFPAQPRATCAHWHCVQPRS